MFKVDTSDIKLLEGDLKMFAFRAYPFATKATVNTAAFTAQKIWRGHIEKKLITRNAFTKRSIQVEQTRTLNVQRQEAIVGSTADYMETQEFGGVKHKKGSEGVAIATSYSSGEGEGAQPRRKLPRKPNRLASIQLQRGGKRGGSRKQKNLVAIQQAAQSGSKYVFLDLGRTKGIFKVTGGKRRPKIKMVYSFRKQSVVIPKTPTMAPSVDKTELRIPGIYKDSLEFQLKRLGLFR